ncbi:unnamed protein product [Oikopleura dioica]|uniref:Uncharacterized protein n=1 Tax=Oikopleura dioica TaxID=34765 RepID=E4YLE0_OIKDI|nr:unnamed protein product [Oikopleura dioica]
MQNICPEKWEIAFMTDSENPIALYNKVMQEENKAVKQAEKDRQNYKRFGDRSPKKSKNEKKGWTKSNRKNVQVNDVNSGDGMVVDGLTGKIYREVKGSRIPSHDIARLTKNKVVWMNARKLSEKFRSDVNKSLRRVKDKTFKSSEPRQGRYRAVDIKDVELEFYAYAMALEEVENRPFFGEPEPEEEYKGFKDSDEDKEDEDEEEDSDTDTDSGRPEIISENNRIFRLMLNRSDKFYHQEGAIFDEQAKCMIQVQVTLLSLKHY